MDDKNIDYIKSISKKFISGKIIDKIYDSIHRKNLIISIFILR